MYTIVVHHRQGHTLAELCIIRCYASKLLEEASAQYCSSCPWLINWTQKQQLTMVVPCQFLHHIFIYYCQWRKVLTAWSILLRQSGQFVKCEEQAIQQHMWPHLYSNLLTTELLRVKTFRGANKNDSRTRNEQGLKYEQNLYFCNCTLCSGSNPNDEA